jgi:hypothetical protein
LRRLIWFRVDRSVIEQAYSFFHQKLKVYEHSTSEREMDHIEDTIASYADAMSPSLFRELSGGHSSFLHEHPMFLADLRHSVAAMETMLSSGTGV